mmetsp:Transcript_14650/g.19281  ORF Transcript_14650/g.19281 Transcript_14650/m.19281 type:complete len:94 (-) Transcript_14650:1562-1843(-)
MYSTLGGLAAGFGFAVAAEGLVAEDDFGAAESLGPLYSVLQVCMSRVTFLSPPVTALPLDSSAKSPGRPLSAGGAGALDWELGAGAAGAEEQL